MLAIQLSTITEINFYWILKMLKISSMSKRGLTKLKGKCLLPLKR